MGYVMLVGLRFRRMNHTIGLRLDLQRVLPLSYITYLQRGYRLNQHRSYQFAYHDWGLYLSKLVGLSDCFLSLIIGSAHSLLSFTVRSSTTIVTSWEDNLEQAWSLGQLLSDSYSLLQREISLPLLIYGLIRSTHNILQGFWVQFVGIYHNLFVTWQDLHCF